MFRRRVDAAARLIAVKTFEYFGRCTSNTADTAGLQQICGHIADSVAILV